jgi:tetratricopeptide (TPR) repeat protein/predicted Ser/Thr protein kinase
MIGNQISHYRITEKIGSGGMGEVYLAQDMKLKRQVALKFLPRQMTADPEARMRFEREAQAAAALNHLNIVTVYEIGEHEGQVFIAMEYVEGKTLKEIISANLTPSALRPMPISQVLDIAIQIASGLAAAHAKDIVHRDIKPQNVMVEKDGRVKILDFGLAKLRGANPLTQESLAMGTVHYMSPEQGIGREVDPRSDIWSLGVVLYQLVSGELPFRGEYDQAVIYAIMNEDTPPLGVEAIPGGAGMENIIRRCLAKKRQERFPSAEALIAALRELVGAGVSPRPEKGPKHKWPRRTFLIAIPLLLISGLLGLLALNPKVHAGLAMILGRGGKPQARHIAVLPIPGSGDADARALGNGFTAVITDKLTWLEKFHDSLWTVSAADVFASRVKLARELQRLWGCNLFVSGDLQAEKNSLRLRLNLQDAVTGRQWNQVELQGSRTNLSVFQEGLLPKLLELLGLPARPGADREVNFGGTSMPGAFTLFLKGQGAIQDGENSAGLERGILLLERALQQDSRYFLARRSLVAAMLARARPGRDEGWLQRAEEQGRRLVQGAGRWAPAQLAWASLLDEIDRKSEALEALRQALRLDERSYPACISLAMACASQGSSGEAEDLFKQAMRLRPAYPSAIANLAYFYCTNGRYDEALDVQKRAIALAPGDLDGFILMGGIFWNKGDQDNARLMFERANAIEPNAIAQSNLATIYFFAGDYRKALPLFHAVARKTGNHVMWGNLADTYRQLPDQRNKAGEAYRRAIAIAEKSLASTPRDVELLSCLARYHAFTGGRQKALELIARARALAPGNLEIIRRAILVHEAVQDRPQALAALQEYRERLGDLGQIEKEPDLAALRADPSYLKMLGRSHE